MQEIKIDVEKALESLSVRVANLARENAILTAQLSLVVQRCQQLEQIVARTKAQTANDDDKKQGKEGDDRKNA